MSGVVGMIIAVMGKSGSGKSDLCAFLQGKGFYHIEADQISRHIMQEGSPVLGEVRRAFGDEFFEDGTLLRKKLGQLVFADRESLDVLNQITGKAVYEAICKEMERHQGRDIAIDAFLLPERLLDLCDIRIAVTADDVVRVQRIMHRDGLSIEDAKNRLSSQQEPEADIILVNNGDKENFLKLVEEVYEKIRSYY